MPTPHMAQVCDLCLKTKIPYLSLVYLNNPYNK